MIRLCVVRLIQIVLFLDSHVIGNNIIVGIIIFSIGVDLGFEYSLVHMYWRLRLIGRGLLPPRRRQILAG